MNQSRSGKTVEWVCGFNVDDPVNCKQVGNMNMKNLALVILASMALPAFAGGLPKVSMKEAMKVENAIIAAAPKTAVAPVPAMLYTQPANHTEPCKLPTNQSQLDRRNFRAYWD